jgi:hypothetical protein
MPPAGAFAIGNDLTASQLGHGAPARCPTERTLRAVRSLVDNPHQDKFAAVEVRRLGKPLALALTPGEPLRLEFRYRSGSNARRPYSLGDRHDGDRAPAHLRLACRLD